MSVANRCYICATPVAINPLKATDFPLCNNVECQLLHRQRDVMPAQHYQHHFQLQQKRIIEQCQNEAAKQEHIRRIETAESRHNDAILQAVKKQIPSGSVSAATSKLEVVALPSGLSDVTPLSAERIANYRDHLQSTIEQAWEAGSIDNIPSDQHLDAHQRLLQLDQLLADHPRISQQLDRLCSICRGGCCASGSDHAYISSASVRRLLDADGALNPDTMLDRFLQYVPTASSAGSCINQTARGCALPRELRSDVCNVYLCDELKQYKQTLQDKADSTQDSPSLTLLIQRANTNWNRFEADAANPVVQIKLLIGRGDGEAEQNFDPGNADFSTAV